MRKLKLLLLISIGSVFLATAPANAQVDFFIDAEIPLAGNATFSVSKVTPGNPDVFDPMDTFNLDFGILSLDEVNFIFLPAFFWVIDVGSDGIGFPDLDFVYVDTANPNGALNDGSGLGGHGTVTFSEVDGNTVTLIRGQSFQQTDGDSINDEDHPDGFLRIAIGIATGDPNLEEGDAVPFTQADVNGPYSGTLEITAFFD